MHYIRLLRPPTAGRLKGQEVLSIAIAITTDLNDAFLAPHEPVELVIFGAGAGANPVPVNLTPERKPKWEAGMRALKLDIPFPRNSAVRTIQIRPANRNLTAFSTSSVYPGPSGDGLILPVYADVLSSQENDRHLICFRSLRLPKADDEAVVSTLKIEELMGESMAGHVWDGGLVTVSLVADLCHSPPTDEKKTPLPILSSILHQDRPLHVIELGCGVGILGVGFARALALSASAGKKGTHVLMTDLAEAEERARANIAICADQAGWTSDSAPFGLDFEALDWNDGKVGVFGPEVLARPWDLVVLSDCTYNDLLPALVQTLSALHRLSAERGSDTKIMLATKPRHKAEREFFSLMKADGWGIAEKILVPLPVLYSEPEAVQVYLFSKN